MEPIEMLKKFFLGAVAPRPHFFYSLPHGVSWLMLPAAPLPFKKKKALCLDNGGRKFFSFQVGRCVGKWAGQVGRSSGQVCGQVGRPSGQIKWAGVWASGQAKWADQVGRRVG